MAMQGMQLRPSKKEEQDKKMKELELISGKLGLDPAETVRLGDLSKKFNIPPERIAATIFLNNATPNRLNWLRNMALDRHLSGDEKLRYSRIYGIMMEISEPTGFQKEYREIKSDYLSLVNKIRDPENMNIFGDYSKDLMLY